MGSNYGISQCARDFLPEYDANTECGCKRDTKSPRTKHMHTMHTCTRTQGSLIQSLPYSLSHSLTTPRTCCVAAPEQVLMVTAAPSHALPPITSRHLPDLGYGTHPIQANTGQHRPAQVRQDTSVACGGQAGDHETSDVRASQQGPRTSTPRSCRRCSRATPHCSVLDRCHWDGKGCTPKPSRRCPWSTTEEVQPTHDENDVRKIRKRKAPKLTFTRAVCQLGAARDPPTQQEYHIRKLQGRQGHAHETRAAMRSAGGKFHQPVPIAHLHVQTVRHAVNDVGQLVSHRADVPHLRW